MAPRNLKRKKPVDTVDATTVAPTPRKKRVVVELSTPKIRATSGVVMTCGQGDVGQLGHGEKVLECTKFRAVTSLKEDFVDVQAGGMHTVALDSQGQVWTWGCNDEQALGRATTDETEGVPGVVTLPQPAAAISAGDSHTAALLDNGDVYIWGSFRDSHGSMGLMMFGRTARASREPQPVMLGEPAAAIASGSDHLVVLTTSNSVYTMGCGEQGQLGRVTKRSCGRDNRQGVGLLLNPGKLTFKASRVWAGYYATFALDQSGKIMHAWGLNNYCQLGVSGGVGHDDGVVWVPREANYFTAAAGTGNTWLSVAPGQHHTLALDIQGNAYAIGRGEYGRLGLGRGVEANELQKLPLKDVIHVAAGISSSLAVTRDGRAFGWGAGGEGQLGTGAMDDYDKPTPCQLQRKGKVVSASTGGQHSALLLQPAVEGAARADSDAKVSSTSGVDLEQLKLNGSDKDAMEVDEAEDIPGSEDMPEEKVQQESTAGPQPEPAEEQVAEPQGQVSTTDEIAAELAMVTHEYSHEIGEALRATTANQAGLTSEVMNQAYSVVSQATRVDQWLDEANQSSSEATEAQSSYQATRSSFGPNPSTYEANQAAFEATQSLEANQLFGSPQSAFESNQLLNQANQAFEATQSLFGGNQSTHEAQPLNEANQSLEASQSSTSEANQSSAASAVNGVDAASAADAASSRRERSASEIASTA